MVGDYSRIADWAKSFDKLLEDPDGVACFQDFLKKEFAEENIKFWLACRDYEALTDSKQVTYWWWNGLIVFIEWLFGENAVMISNYLISN